VDEQVGQLRDDEDEDEVEKDLESGDRLLRAVSSAVAAVAGAIVRYGCDGAPPPAISSGGVRG
jgi:hypothetical protein